MRTFRSFALLKRHRTSTSCTTASLPLITQACFACRATKGDSIKETLYHVHSSRFSPLSRLCYPCPKRGTLGIDLHDAFLR
ncbi:hypothetical protein BOTBODRAFT_522030 [Botryobasidium botryosum FD-172 SS1]|uniref:Uncharacterized protein n=1 Tax=Botryobasidium botryosum (strain FD-172 SS1) TaxID=930990 RepID=A0A067M217_BOTB1|nr:hypothetical protein BOTBODRAFT_522030 [Botryobasidium botryosum FD-172 SS1]